MTQADEYTAVVLVGHGSRDPEGVSQFQQCARLFRDDCQLDVEFGFLEFAHPTIDQAVEKLVSKGHRAIIALPVMLTAAGHTKNDIPSELNALAKSLRIKLRYGADLGVCADMLQAARARIEAAEATVTGYNREDSMLLVVGRGTSDPDANGNVAKITRMLWEGMGFAWAQTCYIGVTQPMLHQALALIDHLPIKRVLVFPYFLFTGVLVKKIRRITGDHRGQQQLIPVDYLDSHPLVLQSLHNRLREAIEGEGNMNCQMCVYRQQIIGHEHLKGQAQQGHHFHVRGVGVDHHHPKTGTKK